MPRERNVQRSLSSLADEQLIREIKTGSELHFNELYRRYFQRIYSFAHLRVHNHADAEEIAQETFTAAFRSLDAFRGQSTLLSWIYGIAKNTVNNHIRRNKAQEQRIERAETESLLGPRPSMSTGTPEEQLNLQRTLDEIRSRMDGVAEWQSEVFVMRHVHDLSIGEICEQTGRSSDAIRSSLYRVKRLIVEAADFGSSTAGGS